MDFELQNFSIKISTPMRAVMECLYLVPAHQELMEAYELMEGLNNIRPQQAQRLLEKCNSVKVNRLFLYMAEKANHQWFSHLDVSKINVGKGKRSIVRNGVYNSKYQITISQELEAYGKNNL